MGKKTTELTADALPASTDLLFLVNPLAAQADANKKIEISDLFAANVKHYGAIGDGVADDTTAIKNAGDSTNVVYFPDGTYIVSSASWTIPVELTLSDRATIKHKSTATDHMLKSTSRLVIRGGTLDGNKAGQTGRFELVNNSAGAELIVEGVRFTNSVKAGINANGVTGMVRVANCYFTGMEEHSGVDGETTKCVDTNGATPVIELVSNVCIGDVPSVNTRATGGFFLSGTSQSVRVTNNYFKNIGQNGGTDAGGNLIACVQLYTDADESVIANNIFEDSFYSPIKAQNANNVSITGNIIRGWSGDADADTIIFYGHSRSFATAVTKASITGNVIDIAGDTDHLGIIMIAALIAPAMTTQLRDASHFFISVAILFLS